MSPTDPIGDAPKPNNAPAQQTLTMGAPAGDLVYGVDEAGRGPLVGPMALAVVAVDPAGAARLAALGVQDSKRFGSDVKARARRAELAAAIRQQVSGFQCTLVDVETIDEYTFRGELNLLEREVATRLLVALNAARDARIICDGARMFAPLTRLYPHLEAVNNGEAAHVAVAAASVLAKHARDEAFTAIATRYEPEFGPIAGGGYANAATRRFINAYKAKNNGQLPPEARKSWGAPKRQTKTKTKTKRASKPTPPAAATLPLDLTGAPATPAAD